MTQQPSFVPISQMRTIKAWWSEYQAASHSSGRSASELEIRVSRFQKPFPGGDRVQAPGAGRAEREKHKPGHDSPSASQTQHHRWEAQPFPISRSHVVALHAADNQLGAGARTGAPWESISTLSGQVRQDPATREAAVTDRPTA